MTTESMDDRMLMAEDQAPDSVSFACPRCGQQVETRFYGPCDACAMALQATYQPAAKDVEAPEYEPKMNVTPNAVATKE